MNALDFADLARSLGDVARSHGLDVPSFVGRVSGGQRGLTRTPSGCTVKVRRDRERGPVADDLIVGIAASNGVLDSHPAVVAMYATVELDVRCHPDCYDDDGHSEGCTKEDY